MSCIDLKNGLSQPTASALLGSRDTANLLGISTRKLFSLTAPRGKLPYVSLGRSVRYDVRDVNRFIEAVKIGGREGDQ